MTNVGKYFLACICRTSCRVALNHFGMHFTVHQMMGKGKHEIRACRSALTGNFILKV